MRPSFSTKETMQQMLQLLTTYLNLMAVTLSSKPRAWDYWVNPNTWLVAQPMTWDIDRDLNLKIDYFDSVGDKSTADIFRWLKNEKDWLFWSFKNDLIDQYAAFQESLNPSFNQFLGQSQRIANEILPWIKSQQELVNKQFWPSGELYNQATNYYKNMMDAVNNAVSWQVASAANQWIRAWASQSSINQALNEARNAGLPQLSKVQSEKLAQQQNLLNNFLQLNDSLRQQQFNYENELIRNPLLQLNQQISTLGQWLVSGLWQYDVARLQDELQRQAQDRALAQRQALIGTQRAAAVQSAPAPVAADPYTATGYEANGKAYSNQIIGNRKETYTTSDWAKNVVYFDANGNNYLKGANWYVPLV